MAEWRALGDNEALYVGDRLRVCVNYTCLAFTCPSSSDLRTFRVVGMSITEAAATFDTPWSHCMAVFEGIADESSYVGLLKAEFESELQAFANSRTLGLRNRSVSRIERYTVSAGDRIGGLIPALPGSTTWGLVAIAVLAVVGLVFWKTR